MRQGTAQLPLGAVRADDGSVVVPETVRADGTVRKPIRIRQGHVPQDEVAKYKPIGQRLREQQSKERSPVSSKSADAVADELSALSLGGSAKASPPPPLLDEKKRERPSRPLERKNPPRTAAPAQVTSAKAIKSELSTVNRKLREIAKLEAFAEAAARGDDGARPLTDAQTRKAERKPQLELRRREIVAALESGETTTEERTEETKPSQTLRVIEM